jgi:CreA protein
MIKSSEVACKDQVCVFTHSLGRSDGLDISRSQTGGVKGELGMAEETSDAAIACRQNGPIRFIGERVFDEHRSLVFKKLQVVHFFDRERNVLVYVAYSDRIIDESPKNSISTVPIMGWPVS